MAKQIGEGAVQVIRRPGLAERVGDSDKRGGDMAE